MVAETILLSLVLGVTNLSSRVYAKGGTPSAPAAATPPSADDLLKDSDKARGALEGGISWEIDVETFEDGGQNKVHYLVKVKGVDALAEAISPARNKGETMLFNDRNLWFFKPGLKKPVAISARQKLMGQAANGDIASTNYYRDYEGKVIGEEKVGSVDCFKLELKAKAKNVTYDGIRYWISKKDHLGLKAEFLTVSGDMFKSALFKYMNKVTLDGKSMQFVSEMDILDALKQGSHTVITYSNPKPENHPDSQFNINNLVR
ncbi:MAG: outer membrane lipoprotein-sorting protein [Deltaproteobacteria bacterium]|nr:outer membrane lipoprotein-sorting protein [Deltaproteobacteria bacterium]